MTDFNLTQLFSTKASERRTIEACGMTFDVWVRRLPAVDVRKYVYEQSADDMGVRVEAGFDALVKSIRKEDGTAFATREDYKKMDSEAVGALIKVFTEVNSKKPEEVGNG